MRVFDLHCDTLTKCMDEGTALRDAGGHLSLAQGRTLDRWAQVFAVFVHDDLKGEKAAAYAKRALDFYDSQRAEIAEGCAPVLSIENGNALMGDIELLPYYYARGVRLLTLTWNGENELGHGSVCGGEGGLTPFGKEVVRRMHALGMVPDVSHLNVAGFWDVAALSEALGFAYFATHSNCAAICPHPRNLSDDQLRAIFKSGGLVGINLYNKFLGGEGSAAQVARHLSHMLSLGGEDCIALGSDFDGCDIHPALSRLDRMSGLRDELMGLGFTEGLLDKFFWDNSARFFTANNLMAQK